MTEKASKQSTPFHRSQEYQDFLRLENPTEKDRYNIAQAEIAYNKGLLDMILSDYQHTGTKNIALDTVKEKIKASYTPPVFLLKTEKHLSYKSTFEHEYVHVLSYDNNTFVVQAKNKRPYTTDLPYGNFQEINEDGLSRIGALASRSLNEQRLIENITKQAKAILGHPNHPLAPGLVTTLADYFEKTIDVTDGIYLLARGLARKVEHVLNGELRLTRELSPEEKAKILTGEKTGKPMIFRKKNEHRSNATPPRIAIIDRPKTPHNHELITNHGVTTNHAS